ncbi:MAG: YbaN family protein [Arcanobacterium sp.]|nr:YbaN family protein [Arcanobacterium sp.]
MKNFVYRVLGFLFLGLGAIGVVLPLVPTTPFLLLSAFFFSRSSERWHRYLMEHRVFGQYLRNYQNHEMKVEHKTFTLLLMWAGLLFGMWGSGWRPIAIVCLVVIGLGTTIHLSRLEDPIKKAKRLAKDEARAEREKGLVVD